jgi:peroxiredoxin
VATGTLAGVERRRRLAVSLLAAGIIGVAGGWWLSSTGGGADRLGAAGADTIPDEGIPVATDVTGQQLPDVEAKTLDGQAVALASLAGQPLVLNFWYSTCLPCRQEMPAFQQVHQAVGDRVRIIGVNPLDSADRARAYADQVGVTYELLRDPDGRVATGLGIARYPTTVFIGADGTILATAAGQLSAEELQTRIDELYPS